MDLKFPTSFDLEDKMLKQIVRQRNLQGNYQIQMMESLLSKMLFFKKDLMIRT